MAGKINRWPSLAFLDLRYWYNSAIGVDNKNYSTTGTLGAGATTVTSLDAGSGAITTTGKGTFGTSSALGLEVLGSAEFNEFVRIGSSTAPTVALDVTGAGLISTTLGVTGLTTATGGITLGAGTTTVWPLRFTSGTSLTDAVAGTLEYNGACLYFTEVIDRRCISVAADTIVAPTSVSNTTNETVLFTGSISAAELKAGKVIRVTGMGKLSTDDASNVVTLRVKIGTVTIITMASTAKIATDKPWHTDCTMTIRTAGAGGTVSGHGHVQIEDTDFSDNTSSQAIDTTAANNVTITAQWNTADADDIITIDQGYIEVLT